MIGGIIRKDDKRSRRSTPGLAIGLAGLLLAEAALAAPVDLVRQDLVTSTCMDGTPAAFYYDENATATDKWVVILQGSNLCSNVAADDGVEAVTVGACARWCFANEGKASMQLDLTGAIDDPLTAGGAPDGLCDLPQASSSTWGQTLTKGSLFDGDSMDNPAFHDAQKIFVRSCSGDGWMGDRSDVVVEGPVSTPLDMFNFHGQQIIDEVIDFLQSPGLTLMDKSVVQMTDGDQLLFGGESRGAFGAWANIDRVCSDLANVLPNLSCSGISASFFPGKYKPKWREDPKTHQPILTQTFAQWVDVRKKRYQYQGIAHPANCEALFPEITPLSPVGPYDLDLDDTSQEMCYTDLGILLSVATPMFVSFNRFNYVDIYQWGAGCDRRDSPPLAGGPECFNNQLAREAGIQAIADRLPASFATYLAASDRHLYLIDQDCQDRNDGCWIDQNCLSLSGMCSTDTRSKADLLRDWLLGSVVDQVFWDIPDNYPFP